MIERLKLVSHLKRKENKKNRRNVTTLVFECDGVDVAIVFIGA